MELAQWVVGTIGSWMADEAGASLVEYILLVALVAVVSIAAITFLGKSAKGKFELAANTIKQ
jgi:Flp pilus assembly pilin Flp